MFNDGNGANGSHGWRQSWRNRIAKPDTDLSSYRRLAVQLHHGLPREAEKSRSVLMVTPNEQRYWANDCVTLASCMAEELRRPVLLAEINDMDVSPILSSVDRSPVEILLDPNQPIEQVAMQTSQPNLWFLSMGSKGDRPFEISTDSAENLLERAAEHWDFVILGGGPVLRNSSALAMAPYVGRVLLLVRESHTQLEDIDVANDALRQCGAENVGLLMTEPDKALR